MYHVKFALFSLFSLFICAHATETDVSYAETASMYYKLGDYVGAGQVCRVGLGEFPDSERLKQLNFRVVVESGDIRKAIQLIKEHPSSHTISNYSDLSMVETLAWGVLSHVTPHSDSMQLMSLIGAFFTHDARAVELIRSHLTSSNALLRAHATHAVVNYRDDVLKLALRKQFECEKNYYVRLDMIKALGALKLTECTPLLKGIIASERATDEEKFAAIASLISMYEKLEVSEFNEMARSPRSGLRRASCEAAAHFEFLEGRETIVELLSDSSSDVCISALNALVLLGIDGLDQEALTEKVNELILSNHAALSLTAEWLKVRGRLHCKASRFAEWLGHEHDDVRAMAASALALYGPSMQSEMIFQLRTHMDPYVKLNLAFGLIRAQAHIDQALDAIHMHLIDGERKLMRTVAANPYFSVIAPSKVRHTPVIPQYPEVVDQLVRLELINLLTIFDYPKTREMLKDLLKKQTWTVIGTTASILIEEGELDGIDFVKELLDDPDPAIATQAALVLAYLGKDPSVVPLLTKTYEHADWELKIQILEALGRIGEQEAVPFLIKTLEEPFQLLKIISASSLIQCLYH